MARQQQRLPADRIAHVVVAADDTGEAGCVAEEALAGALQRGKGALTGLAGGGLVDHHAGVIGSSPFAAPGPMPASASASPLPAAASVPPRRRARSSRVATSRRAPAAT
jgi:hypothetical protein